MARGIAGLGGACLALMGGAGAAQEARTIQVATHYTPEQAAPLEACFDAFEAANPGVTVEHQQTAYGDFLQTILTSRVGGTSPDIYNVYSVWVPQLASAGVLEPPPADIAEFVAANYAPATQGAVTIGGQLWGIPTELSVYALVYNKALLAEAGYTEPPKTWAELREIAQKITRVNDQGNIDVGGYAYGTTVAEGVHPFYAQMFAAGVPPFAEDGRSTNLTSPEAVRILSDQAALFADGITGNEIVVDNFVSNAVGMQIAANWNKFGYQEAYGEAFADTVGVAPIPTDGPGGTMLYSFLWTVDAASDVKDDAWALLRFLSEPREGGLSCTGEAMAAMGAFAGSDADLAAMTATADDFDRAFIAEVTEGRAVTQPNVWQASEVDRILRGYIDQAWSGGMAPADALAAADAEIQAILSEQP
ncbi:ABC transporter substrate-binding protein [Rubellimicrobium aerolatum]|uniref:ABC transporter substrate-binding protein n=1 Tax=Rubellimicrobium aerolatum TaxID=490979 RepID=A0ABW0SF16_9RHOB|nr:sugar ABC transporter substrate-binding protein [Rubellimicrobium aerolatum]MBP1807071.1 multiple sugar transport system substrate-binding protein [Rubellimicrobium aerolatum]